MNTYTLTVTKFNSIIKQIFDAEELLHNVKIVGEVFGVSYARGSVYFSVKDEESSLPCICFRGELFEDIKEGDQVTITGSPNFYVKGGRFSFVVNKIEKAGLGLLFQKFMELKAKLESEGIFDPSHKKPMPKSIKRIGVVTSRDGAVIQDIKNVTWRRNPSIDIVLYHTKVQGINAEKEIAEGINFFSNYQGVDVVIVARGGGSLEDLAAYNTELVARAAYDCNKPIISAVGHETDFTIIDFACDLRAPTPSAAAELLTSDTKNLYVGFKKDVLRLQRIIDNFIADKKLQQTTDISSVINLYEKKVDACKRTLCKTTNILSAKAEKLCIKAEYNLKLKISALSKLNPLDILRLGYAKIEQDNKPVGKLKQLDLNKDMDINFIDGQVTIKIGGTKN